MFQPCECVRGQTVVGEHSSWLVTVGLGELRGVTGPVAAGVAYPVDGGGRGEVEQIDEHGCGQLGGEVGHRGSAPVLRADPECA